MIEVRERRRALIRCVDIDPFFDASDKKRGFRLRISVWSKYELTDEMPTDGSEWQRVWKKAEVSWVSIGSVNASEAEAFGEAIKIAAKHAAVMDAEHGIGMTHSDTAVSSTGPEKTGPQ